MRKCCLRRRKGSSWPLSPGPTSPAATRRWARANTSASRTAALQHALLRSCRCSLAGAAAWWGNRAFPTPPFQNNSSSNGALTPALWYFWLLYARGVTCGCPVQDNPQHRALQLSAGDTQTCEQLALTACCPLRLLFFVLPFFSFLSFLFFLSFSFLIPYFLPSLRRNIFK